MTVSPSAEAQPSLEVEPAIPGLLAGYLRVSTETQVTDGQGLDVQRDAIGGFAAGRGATIADELWFADEGISGSNGLDSRVGLASALEAIQRGEVAGLVVYRLDRLARDLMLQEQLLAEIWRAGGDVYSCSDGEAQYLVRDDPGDPSRKLIRQVLGAVAEYERSMIRLRLASGRARKAAGGGYAYGAPPFGWRADHGVLVPVDAEQAVIARARALRLGQRDDGSTVSLASVAEQLNAEGLATRNGKAWRAEQVRRILSR